MRPLLVSLLLLTLLPASQRAVAQTASSARLRLQEAVLAEATADEPLACLRYGQVMRDRLATPAERQGATVGRARILLLLGAAVEGNRLLDSLAAGRPSPLATAGIALAYAHAALAENNLSSALRATQQAQEALQRQPSALVPAQNATLRLAIGRTYNLKIGLGDQTVSTRDSAFQATADALRLVRQPGRPVALADAALLPPTQLGQALGWMGRVMNATRRTPNVGRIGNRQFTSWCAVADTYLDSALVATTRQFSNSVPEYARLWHQRGVLWAMEMPLTTTDTEYQTALTQAIRCLQRAVALEPMPRKRMRPTITLGELYRVQGEPLRALTYFAQARRDLHTALGLNPTDTSTTAIATLLARGAAWPELRYLLEQQTTTSWEAYEQTHRAAYLPLYYTAANHVALLLNSQRRRAADATGGSNANLDPATTLDTYALAVEAGEVMFRRTGQASYLTRAFAIAENAKAYRLLTRVSGGQSEELLHIAPALRTTYARAVTANRRWQELALLISSAPVLAVDGLVRQAVDSTASSQRYLDRLRAQGGSQFPAQVAQAFGGAFVLSPTQVAANLPANGSVAAVEYLRRTTYEDGTERERLYAFVVQRTGIRLLRLELPDAFAAQVDSLTRALATPGAGSYARLAAQLYTQILAPVAKVLAPGVRRLIISPDGELWQVPFEALLMRAAPSVPPDYRHLAYAGHRWHISYAHSLTLHGLQQAQPSVPTAGPLLALAPFANAPLSDPRALPFTAGLLQELQRDVAGTYYAGADATPDAFRALAPTCSVLHLATHAHANLTNPVASRLLLAPNSPRPGTTSDADLTLAELHRLHLRPRLVVLSACETGVGRQGGAAESVHSLSWAFSYAGAAAVVATLWRVDDRATAALLSSFYRQLSHHESAETALYEAKRQYIRRAATAEEAHPFYWAGLVLTGDERPVALAPPGSFSSGWPRSNLPALGAGAALLALAGGAWWWQRRRPVG